MKIESLRGSASKAWQVDDVDLKESRSGGTHLSTGAGGRSFLELDSLQVSTQRWVDTGGQLTVNWAGCRTKLACWASVCLVVVLGVEQSHPP